MVERDTPLSLDGRTFVKFHVDAGIGDVILEPLETVTARDWLAFAEIPAPLVTMIAREQQFAEKIHAYNRAAIESQ